MRFCTNRFCFTKRSVPARCRTITAFHGVATRPSAMDVMKELTCRVDGSMLVIILNLVFQWHGRPLSFAGVSRTISRRTKQLGSILPRLTRSDGHWIILFGLTQTSTHFGHRYVTFRHLRPAEKIPRLVMETPIMAFGADRKICQTL